MPIILDDVLKTVSNAYLFATYVHQPFVGTVYGKLLATLMDRLKDPGTSTEDVASYIQQQNINTLNMLIRRELEQLQQEGYNIKLKNEQ